MKKVIEDFYEPFKVELDKLNKELEYVKIDTILYLKCGGLVQVRKNYEK